MDRRSDPRESGSPTRSRSKVDRRPDHGRKTLKEKKEILDEFNQKSGERRYIIGSRYGTTTSGERTYQLGGEEQLQDGQSSTDETEFSKALTRRTYAGPLLNWGRWYGYPPSLGTIRDLRQRGENEETWDPEVCRDRSDLRPYLGGCMPRPSSTGVQIGIGVVSVRGRMPPDEDHGVSWQMIAASYGTPPITLDHDVDKTRRICRSTFGTTCSAEKRSAALGGHKSSKASDCTNLGSWPW